MRSFSRITIWENRRRLARLERFVGLISRYFSAAQPAWVSRSRIQTAETTELRKDINQMVYEIDEIVVAARVNPTLTWTPPPAVGGYVKQIDLIQNIFHLDSHQIAPQTLVDQIDRAIGIYQADTKRALVRSINPLFYVGLLLDMLVSIPFIVIGKAGFDRSSIERSRTGRLLKVVLYVVTTLASLLTILQLLGLLSITKQIVSSTLGIQLPNGTN